MLSGYVFIFNNGLYLQIGSTWSNLTGVNISLDDLSLSSSKKSPSNAPSMNQLATEKSTSESSFSCRPTKYQKKKKLIITLWQFVLEKVHVLIQLLILFFIGFRFEYRGKCET